MALKDTIAKLAEQFATQVLAAIRSASFDDVAALSGGRARPASPAAAGPSRRSAPSRAAASGRRRRTKEDIEALGQQIVELLAQNPEGLRAEQIREQLGVPRKELPRALAAIVESGSARKQGEKRATTYYAGGSSGRGGGKRGAKKGGKRGGKKGGKRGAKKAAESTEG